LARIGDDRHRVRGLNQAHADGADRGGGNGILRKTEENAAGGSVHRLLLFRYAVPRTA
jgi:hypothetical protein